MHNFFRRSSCIAFASALVLTVVSVHALALTPPKKPVEPTVIKTPTGTVEVGTLDGAPYRIDIPIH